MRFQHSIRLILILSFLAVLSGTAAASSTISINDFKTQSDEPFTEFQNFLKQALSEAGFSCSNSTDSACRYSLSGLVEKDKKSTSFSALLTDNYHLEPEVFINGKQIGGKTSKPAATRLAKSVTQLLLNQTIMSVEVSGDNRLTPNAIMALAQIVPGEVVTPEKIIAARVILENCGLFDQAQLYLTPSSAGRNLKISVKEKDVFISGNMPGPGKIILDNILGPPTNDLPEFPISPTLKESPFPATSNTGALAYEAGRILEDLSHTNGDYSPEKIEELVAVATSLRNKIFSYDKSCRHLCLILMKMCSLLDSKTVKAMIEDLQSGMEQGAANSADLNDALVRIEFISQAYNAAQEAQLILASRLYTKEIHSPITPWVLYSLGKQALAAEEVTKAAPLLAGAISISSLPVSPEMLLTTAKAQYSNLDRASGDAATEMLRPILAKTDLNPELRKEIHELSQWASLCETVTAITDEDIFDLQLKKGDALILLDRPDLAEPLFHELHSEHPNDARPFTGFARLAFQRTGNLLSARPYIERAAKLSKKDRFFYETALAYKMERIIGEALPTIHLDGRNSEEASATRFLLPKAMEYAKGYEQFNKPQAKLLEAGINVLDKWLAYPSLQNNQALEQMFKRTSRLRELMPHDAEIIAANFYFSIYAAKRKEAREALSRTLIGTAGLKSRFLQLNLLIREMSMSPSKELAESMEYAARATFSDARNRSEAVALQADTHALLGIFHNSTKELKKADSLYELAVDLSKPAEIARLLNNHACVNLMLGNKSDADDLYDEALDNDPVYADVINFGKIKSSLSKEDQAEALQNLAGTTKIERIKITAGTHNDMQDEQEETQANTNSGNKKIQQRPHQQSLLKMNEVLLNEKKFIEADYDNYKGLQLIFKYESNLWLLPSH